MRAPRCIVYSLVPVVCLLSLAVATITVTDGYCNRNVTVAATATLVFACLVE